MRLCVRVRVYSVVGVGCSEDGNTLIEDAGGSEDEAVPLKHSRPCEKPYVTDVFLLSRHPWAGINGRCTPKWNDKESQL